MRDRSSATHASRPDRFAGLTDRQREAITTIGKSLLVSAAAGSGKTTVLAERCAYLLCDVEEPHRCNVDELLVVTFTDAAAGEMRTRIGRTIRDRLAERPNDARLRNQLFLLDNASISTIHAFCKTIVQKWFPQAGIDPQAAVLSGDEAELLRLEVLDALFVELYGRDDDLGTRFQTLVDDYGAGRDKPIADVVLQVHAFINSLPDPQAWLDHSVRQVDSASPQSLIANVDDLQRQRLQEELRLQIEYWQSLGEIIHRRWPEAESRIEAAGEMVYQLKSWLKDLDAAGGEGWQDVLAGMSEYKLKVTPAPRKASEEEKAAYAASLAVIDKARKTLASRLQSGLCLFTVDEYREGLERIAPYVATLAQIVGEFDRRYQDAKSAQAAMDFNDLQRGALRLLAADGDPTKPSDIARQLQRQYRHVLVDEFQDVDPLQASILRVVSRETADPPEGNLFAVGDIKQSIYRFRLAEPKLFTERADEFAGHSPIGRLIPLQQNFRSRAEVINAVNRVFEGLMSRSFGGSEYGDADKLHAGATYPDPAAPRQFGRPAVEVHLLEPITQKTAAPTAETEEGRDIAEATDGEELEGIDREGWLIAQRIREWMGLEPGHDRRQVADRPPAPGEPPATRSIRYGDIVILLRSMVFKADPIADILRRRGIPVRLEASDDRLDSTEFRDVFTLLQVLDNRQQDIPLAAVLRSPLLGEPFSEGDLLRIRLLDRSVPFHGAASRYLAEGPEGALRRRLGIVSETLDRWRDRIRREPVADVLWDIYEQTGYLAYVAGLPDGARRQGHLVRLHELARQFGRFARQGLRRFLRYLEDLIRTERSAPQAPSATQEDAVRIMSIHSSKGLEFPVVILADLAKRFNLADSRGMVLMDREIGLAMQVADPERRVRYPTLIHQLAAQRIQQESLSEELRVLYVALTRAREHLVLVGRGDADRLGRYRTAEGVESGPAPPRMELETAVCPLDWLLAAIGRLSPNLVTWPEEEPRAPESALFDVQYHPRSTTDRWAVSSLASPEEADRLAALATLPPLPKEEPIAAETEAGQIVAAVAQAYPAEALTRLPARVAVSDLKRRWDASLDPEERSPAARVGTVPSPAFLAEAAPAAVDVGTATHRFLQLVDLARPCDAADLALQREEFVAAGRLSETEAGSLMLDGAAWFFTTELGRLLCARSGDVHREVAFVWSVPPERYKPAVAAHDNRDVVLVRGMVDVVLPDGEGLQIIDYKTDRVEAGQCPARAEAYRGQLDHYAAAMSGIWKRPVTARRLVFLHARQTVDLGPA